MEEKINNKEISDALKEFEDKNLEDKINSYKAIKFYDENDTPKMVGLVMKLSGGTIKNQKTAEYILLALIILMFGLSFYFFFKDNLNKKDINIQDLPDQTQFVE